MSERELLEKAAKAAGIWDEADPSKGLLMGTGQYWNPLTDDGDALRLAVKLRIQIEHCRTMGGKFIEVHAYPSGRGDCAGVEPYEFDPCAAVRRAIVRAAASLGEKMT